MLAKGSRGLAPCLDRGALVEPSLALSTRLCLLAPCSRCHQHRSFPKVLHGGDVLYKPCPSLPETREIRPKQKRFCVHQQPSVIVAIPVHTCMLLYDEFLFDHSTLVPVADLPFSWASFSVEKPLSVAGICDTEYHWLLNSICWQL